MTTKLDTVNPPVVVIADPKNPDGIHLAPMFIGKKSRSLDGSISADFIRVKKSYIVRWPPLTSSQYNAIYNLIYGGVYPLYIQLPDGGGVLSVMPMGEFEGTERYSPGGVYYDSASVTFEET